MLLQINYSKLFPRFTFEKHSAWVNTFGFKTILIVIIFLLGPFVMPTLSAEEMPPSSALSLPTIISDGMIFQQKMRTRVWGHAEPGKSVTIQFEKQTVSAIAGTDGNWMAWLEPLTAGGPFIMTVSDKTKTLTIKDILVGEVWFASGQSNMQMSMDWPPFKAKEEIQKANWPQIREFSVPMASDIKPRMGSGGKWQTCSPQTVSAFSAVGYFFARELHSELKVPIGIICVVWGGTGINAWIDRENLGTKELIDSYEKASTAVLQAGTDLKLDDSKWMNPAFDDSQWKEIPLPLYWDYVLYPIEWREGFVWARRTVDIPAAWVGKKLRLEMMVHGTEVTYFDGHEIGKNDNYAPKVSSYDIPPELVKGGKATIAVRVSKLNWWGSGIMGEPLHLIQTDDPKQEISLDGNWKYAAAELHGPRVAPGVPSVLYNGMVFPLSQYTLRGFLWYQGEANGYPGLAQAYAEELPRLIHAWRKRWNQGDIPFYIVQLPNWHERNLDPNVDDQTISSWAILRESQTKALSLPNTGMAVTIDIGEANELHPPDKLDVGKRLALIALEKTYGRHIHGQSPQFDHMQVEKNQIRIQFKNAEDGLITNDGQPVKGFAIAGADGKFVWATAAIDGSSIVLSSDKVSEPKMVHYGWANNPEVNLYGKNGLPVGPFRINAIP